MSPCIMKRRVNWVLWPGWIVIEPMTGVGGQHPSTTSTYGSSVNRRGWSPELVNRYSQLKKIVSVESKKDVLLRAQND